MEQHTSTPLGASPIPFRRVGFWAVALGALGVALVFLQITGPSLTPEPSAGSQIGEIAGEIKRAAWRTFLGLPKPEPEVQPMSIWPYLGIAAPVLGIVALMLSLVSGLKRENWRYAAYGTCLGASAIFFQFFWMLAVLVAAVALLVAIIENIGDIFSF